MTATEGTAPSLTSDKFGAGRLFMADTRLALAVLNYARRRSLERVFGISPQQANLLSVALALTVADATYLTARKAVRAPLRLGDIDPLMGGVVGHQAALGITGPAGEAIPGVGALLGLAFLGTIALPGVRRALHNLRLAEARVRQHRLLIYREARRALAG